MHRPTILLAVAVASIAVAPIAVAGNGSGTGADPTETFLFSGPVISFTASSGSGMPMLTVDDAVAGPVDIALGPVWFLQTAGFVAVPGDEVEAEAFGCVTCAAPYVAAWVDNLTTGVSVDLRDVDARPVWIQRQSARGGSGRPGQGSGAGGQTGGSGTGGSGTGGQTGGSGTGGSGTGGQTGGSGGGTGEPGGAGTGSGSGPANGSGLDMSQVETVGGSVVSFNGQAGSGEPVVVLDVGGELIEITLSPYQPIAAAGLVIEPGITLTVTFAPTLCDDETHLVAISIVDDATGVLVQLRDPETGFPMAPGGGHNQPNWP
jgi:hypothetical protein